MAKHEAISGSDEWYTPAWIFEALNCGFDMDVAHPGVTAPTIPVTRWCNATISEGSLAQEWRGHVWMNPPFGGRNGYRPWAKKFIEHGNGIALAPNRTGAPWWQEFATRCDTLLFVTPKIKFLRPDGSEGKSPGYGSVLMAIGREAQRALEGAALNRAGLLASVRDPRAAIMRDAA